MAFFPVDDTHTHTHTHRGPRLDSALFDASFLNCGIGDNITAGSACAREEEEEEEASLAALGDGPQPLHRVAHLAVLFADVALVGRLLAFQHAQETRQLGQRKLLPLSAETPINTQKRRRRRRRRSSLTAMSPFCASWNTSDLAQPDSPLPAAHWSARMNGHSVSLRRRRRAVVAKDVVKDGVVVWFS